MPYLHIYLKRSNKCALTAVPLHAGVVLPLLQQSILIWQVSLGYLILGKRLTPAEVCLPAWLTNLLTCCVVPLQTCMLVLTHMESVCSVPDKIMFQHASTCSHVHLSLC